MMSNQPSEIDLGYLLVNYELYLEDFIAIVWDTVSWIISDRYEVFAIFNGTKVRRSIVCIHECSYMDENIDFNMGGGAVFGGDFFNICVLEVECDYFDSFVFHFR